MLTETPKKTCQQPDISPPKIVDSKKRGMNNEDGEENVKRVKKETKVTITKTTVNGMKHYDEFEYACPENPSTKHNVIRLIHATHSRPKIKDEPAASCAQIFQSMVSNKYLEINGHENKHYKAGEHKFVWMGCAVSNIPTFSRYGSLLYEIDPKFLKQLSYKKCKLGTRKFYCEHSHSFLFHNKVVEEVNNITETEVEETDVFFFEGEELFWEAPEFNLISGTKNSFDHPEIAILDDSIHITFDLVKIGFVKHKQKFCYHHKIKGFPCECQGREVDMRNFFLELASIIKNNGTSIPKEVGRCFYEKDIAEIKQKLSEDDVKVLVEHFGWSV